MTLTTLTLGANPDYSSERFYANELDADSQRIAALFEEAPRLGVTLQQRSLSAEELQVCAVLEIS